MKRLKRASTGNQDRSLLATSLMRGSVQNYQDVLEDRQRVRNDLPEQPEERGEPERWRGLKVPNFLHHEVDEALTNADNEQRPPQNQSQDNVQV